MFKPAKPGPFSLSRRAFTLGGAALASAAIIRPAFALGVDGFVDSVWRDAASAGVPRGVFDRAMAGFSPISSVIDLTRKQAEFTSTPADYVNKRVSDARIGTGRSKRGEWVQTLGNVQQRFGVQGEAVLAIWGIETNYGGYMGNLNTVHALATLTYADYRASFFRKELVTALKVLAEGHVTPENMKGSWAGAMGHPQFMPTSFMRYAADYHGDGRKDIWGSVPDALASAANYLKEHGWRPGETWGYEVKLPGGFDYAEAYTGADRSLGSWAQLGVQRANGRAFPRADDMGELYLPMGGEGPAFLLVPNFKVIKRYNNSNSYALAVGHLADRIIGGGSFVTPWPNDTALNDAAEREVQSLLLRKGYDVGAVDGRIGPNTRSAVMAWQKRNGLLADGHVGGRLLAQLRG